jgi:hypothetical protein
LFLSFEEVWNLRVSMIFGMPCWIMHLLPLLRRRMREREWDGLLQEERGPKDLIDHLQVEILD